MTRALTTGDADPQINLKNLKVLAANPNKSPVDVILDDFKNNYYKNKNSNL